MRPVTTLLATGIVWITGVLVACSLAGGYLRHQVLNTTADELKRLDTTVAVAATQSLQGVEPVLARLADRLRGRLDATENAAWLKQIIERSGQIDSLALIGSDGKVLSTIGAWPANLTDIGDKKFFAAAAGSAADSAARFIGRPVEDPATDSFRLPIAQRIIGDQGAAIGGIATMVPLTKLATIPLPDDTRITLLDPEGKVLAIHPARPGSNALNSTDSNLGPIFSASNVTTVRENTSDQEGWRIEAIRPLAGYRIAVSVSRGASATLSSWKYQMFVVAIFALGGAVAIALMMYLIARQIHAHDELSEAYAERLEAERARLEAERAQLEAETKVLKLERLAVLGQVTAAVAQELREPLIAVRDGLETLKKVVTDSGSELEQPVARMERSLERCERMSSDLLEYTRSREMQPKTIRFDQWLEDVVEQQKNWVPFKLSTELRAGNAVAAVDPDRILRLLMDLIENACQAMDDTPTEYEKRITVRTGVAPGLVVLTVIDTGPGISEKDQAHIFEPLFSTKSYGTGLGLSIVKQIVEQHGGVIRVDSEVGHGTRVRVCLPLAAEALPDRTGSESAAAEGAATQRRAAA
ncbi:MAG: GHKL domain-containing protein [Alphaproteobacteria bacterium]|nr:GHKL domain-containing protein [Alphaproteobacteria bacterium]